MSRIFLSHSSLDNRQAIALRQSLIEQNPPLANEIFLDLHSRDGIQAGNRWKDALRQAGSRCEAVICMLSPNWETSTWCKVEYQFADYLNERVFCAAIAPLAGDDPTREWRRVDLYGEGLATEINIGDDGAPVKFGSEAPASVAGRPGGGRDCGGVVCVAPTRRPRAGPVSGMGSARGARRRGVFRPRRPNRAGVWTTLRGMRKSGVATLFVVLGPSGSGSRRFCGPGCCRGCAATTAAS